MHSIIHVDKAKNLNILISTKDKSELNTKSGSQSKAEQLQWRRDKVQDLYSPSMHVGLATVIKDTSTSKQ